MKNLGRIGIRPIGSFSKEDSQPISVSYSNRCTRKVSAYQAVFGDKVVVLAILNKESFIHSVVNLLLCNVKVLPLVVTVGTKKRMELLEDVAAVDFRVVIYIS